MPAADRGAPVTPLQSISLIPELLHEQNVILRNRTGIEAGLVGRVGKSVAGNRWADNVERIGTVPSKGFGVSQSRNDCLKFRKGSGPTMSHNQWQGISMGAFRMDEMQFSTSDIQGVLVKLIQSVEGRFGIVFRQPVADQ